MRRPYIVPAAQFLVLFSMLLFASMRMAAQSAVSSVVVSFPVGANPVSSLLQANDGNNYGVTYSGGASASGTIYQLTPSGLFTTLYSFTGGTTDGGSPAAGLVEGGDGNLYGTTTFGGANDLGTVFRFGAAGLATLHSFDPGADGNSPYAALVAANDGNLYGILAQGAFDSTTGDYYGGTIFSISTRGAYNNLFEFPEDGSLGSFATARLLQASDGNFWGATSSGGSNGYGTLFRWNSADGLTTVHNFSAAEGTAIYGLAELGTSLYGVTFPDLEGAGVIFSVALANDEYSVVYSFSGANDGGSPAAALYAASDGNLYGATQSGGGNSDGTFFRLGANGSPVTLLNFPAGTLNTFADAALLEASNTGIYFPVLYDSASGLSPSSMDGAGSLLLLQPPYSTTPPAPVNLRSNSASVTAGQSVTLTWGLPDSASLTSQQCYAFSTPSSTWSGLQLAQGTQSVVLATAGTYGLALNCGGNQSSVVTVNVIHSTETTLSAPASVAQGSSGTLSAKIVSSGGASPTGTVRFVVDGAITLATIGVTSGAASLTASTAGVPLGSYSIQAIYSGDTNNAPSTSAEVVVSVATPPQSTHITLAASPTSVTPGQPVAFSATVTSSAGTPSGTVSFLYESLLLDTAPLQAGTAAFPASSSGVPAGTYAIHAVYNGSGQYSESSSNVVSVTVQ